MRKNNTVLFALAVVAAAAGSCVTVNVNFPESAVQKATDDYVRELYRAKEKGKENEEAAPTSSWMDMILPSAHAAEDSSADHFQVSNPKTLQIRDRLGSRLDEVLTHKRAGILGETQEGFLATRTGTSVKPLLLKRIEKIVAEENQDRTELYQEVLKINRLPESRLSNVQRSFARSFQSESPSGTWVQDSDGKWSRKP